MKIKDIFTPSSGTKKVVSVLIIIGLIVVTGAYQYYTSLYDQEDPRTLEAKKLFVRYNKSVKEQDFEQSFSILDKIESIYQTHPDYKESFEIGIVHNNRSSLYLMMALYKEDITPEQKNLFLANAEKNALKSVSLYEKWKRSNSALTLDAVTKQVRDSLLKSRAVENSKHQEKIIENRVKEITTCQKEIDRRISVSYTNLGTAQRHQGNLETAQETFIKAIKLWDDNHTAKSNLSVLIGKGEIKKPILQQLFPPSKEGE